MTTSPEADDRIIRTLNAQPNRRRFNLLFRNCADFAKDVLNAYYPGAIHANRIADFGMTTPKQVARSLVAYGASHPEAALAAFAVPQIPGSRPLTHAPKGVMEVLITSKKYLLPLALMPAWIPAGLAGGYLAAGRFDPHGLPVDTYSPADVAQHAMHLGAPATGADDGRPLTRRRPYR